MKNETPRSIPVKTEYIRLDQLLKLAGAFVTGGEAKTAIQSGGVFVNGEICLMRGKKLRPGDRVESGGRAFLVTADEG